MKRSKAPSSLTPADHRWLKQYRIEPEFQPLICRLTDAEARSALGFDPGHSTTSVYKGRRSASSFAGLGFEGHDINGEPLGVTAVRLDTPFVNDEGKEVKYLNPPRSAKKPRRLFCLPQTPTALKQPGAVAIPCEAQKTVFALASVARRLGLPWIPFSMGGKDGWHLRLSDTESIPHPDLMALSGVETSIWLDSNVWSKLDVQKAEKDLALHLSNVVKAHAVTCTRHPAEEGVNGPDDYCRDHADSKVLAVFERRRAPWLWGDTFTSYQQLVEAPTPQFIISKTLQTPGISGIGGPSEHGKSWIVLHHAKAVLTGKDLYGYHEFTVPARIERVLYLVPELLRGQVRHRLELLGMMDLVREGKLLIRALEDGKPLIDVPDILMAARGALVILDTAIRFMTGEESRAEANREGLWERCRQLMAAEALVVEAIHHCPKGWEKETTMSLERAFRGSGDIGAMLSDAIGVRQLDKTANRIHVEHLKPRDQDIRFPFQIQGRPYVKEKGTFVVVKPPGQCGTLALELPKGKGGAPGDPHKEAKLDWAVRWIADYRKTHKEQDPTIKAVVRALNTVKEFQNGSPPTADTTLAKWLKEQRAANSAIAGV